MHQRAVIAAAVALTGATALLRGAGQTPPPQTPTFRAQIEYVEVDALVTDAQGRFVRDLTRDDFQVFEDGRRQTISAFSLVDIPVERAERPLFAAAPLEPDVLSNERPFEGRVYVTVLDDLHTDALRSQQVRLAARQFIERHLGANDLMAIVHTGGRRDAAQEFTSNKRLLLASVDKFMGRKLPSMTVARNEEYFRQLGRPIMDNRIPDPYEVERGYNAQSTMRVLKEVAEWLSGLRGRRKTIIFMSEGIDYDVTDVIRQFDAPGNAASAILDDMRETIQATARSNVSIYAVDPRGLTQLADVSIGVSGWADAQAGVGAAGGPDAAPPPSAAGIGANGLRNELMLSQMNLRALAEETNGYAAVGSNDFARAFDRIVRDNSSYYVLAYYPPTNRRDGRFHRIEVRVSRPGLTVRARRGYVAPRGNPAPAKAQPQGAASAELLEALNSPIQVSGLTMRVFAAPFKGTAPAASVVLGVELNGRDLTLDAGGKLEMSYVAVDSSGKTRAGRTDTVTLNLRPESRARVEQTGLRLVNRLELEPGRYTLRVAARDAVGGRVGAISYDLEVPDFAREPFSIGGLVLTSMSGSAMMTARADEQLRAVLPASPIAIRTFPQNDEIALFAEVYERAGAPPHSVDLATILRADAGTVVFKHEEERQSTELQGAGGGYGYQTRVPLTDVPPGLYVLTVAARSRLGDHPEAKREVMIRVVQGRPAMRVLDKGPHSNIDAPRQAVARTAEQWQALWKSHAPDRPIPAVDFSREMVVAAFLGGRPTGGFEVEIVGAAETDGTLVVQYREGRPRGDAITAQVITSPYQIVALPAYGGAIRFEPVN